MLRSHLESIESTLLTTSQTPREALVEEFLDSHLGEGVFIDRGEIIDCDSAASEKRPTFDVIISKRSSPRLQLSGASKGSGRAYLAESVIATLSVRQKLDKQTFEQDMGAAWSAKKLKRNLVTLGGEPSYTPPSILSYVVAYDGPERMEKIHGWISELQEEIPYPRLPASEAGRYRVAAPALDAVFVLGKGFVHYGNAPIGFLNADMIEQHPGGRWAMVEAHRGSLLLLFSFLTLAISGAMNQSLNPASYLSSFEIGPKSMKIGF